MRGQLKDLLDKGREVLTISGDASVLDAVRKMVDANVGSLLVTEEGKCVAIVTERDYLTRVALCGRTESGTNVREIASSPLTMASPETTIDDCMALMTSRRIRHVPIESEGDIVGIVSIGDIVKFMGEQRDEELRYLNDYITAH